MAVCWTSSAKGNKSFHSFIAVLTSAACEWFLIFLLLVDGVLSYLLTKFAQYCELQTPCLLCSRLDQILGNEKPQFYWSLFCGNHRSEISSLISCNMHGKLADGRAICEDCLLSFTTKEDYSSETDRPFLGNLGLDSGNFCSRPLLRRDFPARSFGTGLCSCCKKPLMSRQKARRLLYRSPVGRSMKPSIPLPRMPNQNRLQRRDGLRKVKDKFSDSFAYDHFTKSSSVRPSHAGYSELKIASDSDPELIYFDEDDRSSIVDDKYKKEDSPVKHLSKTKPKAVSVDLATEKLVQQSSDRCQSLIDADLLFDGERCDVECMDADATIGYNLGDLNSRQGHGGSKYNLSAELISLNDTYQTFSNSQDPLGVFGRDYKSKFPVLKNSKSPSFTDLMSLDVTGPSTGTASEKIGKMEAGPSPISEQVKSSKARMTDTKVDRAIADSDDYHLIYADSSDVLGSTAKTEEKEEPDSKIRGSAQTQITLVNSDGVNGLAVKTEGREVFKTDSASLQPKSAESDDIHGPIENVEAKEKSGTGDEQSQNELDRINDKEKEKLDLPLSENACSQKHAGFGVNGDRDEVQMMAVTSNSNGTDKLQRSLSMDRSESGLESLDGSIISEHEGESIADRLKRQVNYDQKRINALYKELEEERSASAVAANQAMAMITRLQEEKAALHMEALQYLRMMEEQAEHDVDALDRANDLLAEKEKEVQDLEAELEFYRINAPDELAMERMPAESYNLSREDMKASEFTSASVSSNIVNPSDTQMLKGEFKDNKELLVKCSWFEDEKSYISQCLKSLERQLQQVPYDDTAQTLPCSELFRKATNDGENQEPTEDDGCQQNSHLQEDSLCREENTPAHNGHYSDQNASNSSVSDSCLDHTNNHQVSSDRHRTYISRKDINVAGLENEISDLNERLESLEAVHDFIEHMLNNLQSGDAGLQLVQELAQKLRVLQNMGIRIRSQSVT